MDASADGQASGPDVQARLEREAPSSATPAVEDITIAAAPVFRPSLQEWQDPMAYIARIQPVASLAGICTIVPPVKPTADALKTLAQLQITTEWQQVRAAPWAEMRDGHSADGQRSAARAPETGTLASFREAADAFAQSASGGDGSPPEPSVAVAAYWRAREDGECKDPGDRDFAASASGVEGSGFGAEGEGCPLATSRWNLRTLASEPGSVLRHLGHTIPGCTHPTLAVSGLHATMPWHVADHYLGCVGYAHAGAPHSWYAVPAHFADRFENAVEAEMFRDRQADGGDAGVGPGSASASTEQTDRVLQALLAKRVMFHPHVLTKHGVDVVHAVQHPGEFVISFPRVYKCGFAHGFHLAEAVSLCTRDWFPFGADAVARYARLRFVPRMDYDMLLCQEALEIAQAMFSKPSAEMLPAVAAAAAPAPAQPAQHASDGAAAAQPGGSGAGSTTAPAAAPAPAPTPLPTPSPDLTTLLLFCMRVRAQHRRCAALVAGGARMAPMADESAGALCSSCYGVCCMAFALDDGPGPGAGADEPPRLPRCLTCRMRNGGPGAGTTVYLHPTAGVYEAWCRVMEPAVQLVEGGLMSSVVLLGVSESARFGEPGGAASALPADVHPWAWVELSGASPDLTAAAAVAGTSTAIAAAAAAVAAAAAAASPEPAVKSEASEEMPPPPPQLFGTAPAQPARASVAPKPSSAAVHGADARAGGAGPAGEGSSRGVRRAALASAAASREAAAMSEAEALREAAASSMVGAPRQGPGTAVGAVGPVTLKHLVEAGLLSPGSRVLRLEYKGRTYYADLDAGGHITYDRMLFSSPSAFSVYIKRLVTPTRKADDGWKSVRFGGKLLEHYKLRYSEGGATGTGRRAASTSGRGHAPAPAPPPLASARGHTRARGASSPPPPPPPPTTSSGRGAESSPKRPRRNRQVSVRLS